MTSRNYALIESMDALKALIDKLMSEEKPIGFDLETGYLGPNRKKGSLQIDWDEQFVCGFSITNAESWARYVPVAHEFGNNLPEGATWELMKPVLETLPSIAHNAKFEIRNLRALERKGRGPRIDLNCIADSQIESYVLSLYKSHGLKDLVKWVFDHNQPELSSLFPGAKKKDLDALRFNVLDQHDPAVKDYACEDAVWTLKLHEKFFPLVQAQRKLMFDLEMKIMPELCDMEDAGHAVAWEAIQQAHAMGVPFEEEMKTAAKAMLSEQAGEDLSGLNLASTPQMREVLYGKLGLTTTRTTDKGELSTDAIALESLSREHPAVKKVLEVREVHNLTKRMDKWLTEYTAAHDGRVHASFNQVVVGSGRFSANDPAIQQLPKDWRWTVFPKVNAWKDDHWEVVTSNPDRAVPGRHWWGGNFRDFMIAGPDCYLLGFDYSQVELRALAGMSKEPALLKAFNDGVDIHSTTAAMMLSIPLDSVTDKTRAIGKTMNFALVYGMGEQSLSERLAISYAEAERLYAQYFSAFTLVTDWMDEQKRHGKSLGYVETAFKRKVTIWEFQSSFRSVYNKGERLCVNAPVQGTAADLMKFAMLRAMNALKARGWWMSHVRIVNNIHDALVFEVSNEVHPDELRDLLRGAVVWDVVGADGSVFPKIVADWELGQLWGSCEKWKEQPVEFLNGRWRLVDETGSAESAPPLEEVPVEQESEPVREVPETPEALVVELEDMPGREAFGEFLTYLTSHPGSTIVTLRTPEGEVDLTDYATCVTPEDHQGHISLMLGGARVYRPVEQIDMDALSEGMEL